MKITSSFLLRIAAVVLAIGCGGDEDSDCEKVAQTLCAAACSCGGADGCVIGDADSSLTFENASACVSIYSLGCSQPTGGFDFAACLTALDNPTCVQTSDGRALDAPDVCE